MFDSHLWSTLHGTPPYYPDAVTLTPHDSARQQSSISELAQHDAVGSLSVKDSYASLALDEWGFEVVLDAEWIGLSARAAAKHTPGGSLTWRRMTTTSELSRWKATWAQDDSTSVADEIFDDALLSNPEIALLLAFADDHAIGGAALNRGAGVVGLSNIFATDDIEAVWDGLVSEAAAIFPSMSLVGYEREEDLGPARAIGFETIGPLRVWLREGRGSGQRGEASGGIR